MFTASHLVVIRQTLVFAFFGRVSAKPSGFWRD